MSERVQRYEQRRQRHMAADEIERLRAINSDLLAALKEAREYVMLDFPKETVNRIDAVIARAEGRSDGPG